MFPNRFPMEREASSPEPMVYSFIHSFTHLYLSDSSIRSLPKEKGENIWSPSTVLHVDRRAYIQLGAAWFPKGIVYNTATSTPLPCSVQHNTFHLGLGRPKPR